MTPYSMARYNFQEYLLTVAILAEKLAKDSATADELDQFDGRVRNIIEKMHAVSYVLGAASAIKNYDVGEK